MDVYEAIRTRRSVRKYKDTEIPKEHIQKMLESARLAPSGNNTQPWRFIVIRDQEMKKRLYEVCQRQRWMLEAPVLIACVADLKARLKDTEGVRIDETSPDVEVKKIIRDTTIASEHIVLEAQELGLSTCWIAWFVQEDVRPILNIPEDKYVIAIITVGYSDQNPKPRPRKALTKIVHFEKWGGWEDFPL